MGIKTNRPRYENSEERHRRHKKDKKRKQKEKETKDKDRGRNYNKTDDKKTNSEGVHEGVAGQELKQQSSRERGGLGSRSNEKDSNFAKKHKGDSNRHVRGGSFDNSDDYDGVPSSRKKDNNKDKISKTNNVNDQE